MSEFFSNFSSFFIYLYCDRKASEIFIFHLFSLSKMRRGGCSLTSTLKLISKLLEDFSTRISRVATHQGSQKASSRAKHSVFSEVRTNSSETASETAISQILSKESIPKPSFQQLSHKFHLRRENLPESCFLSHNNVNHCLEKYSKISHCFVRKGQIPKGYSR